MKVIRFGISLLALSFGTGLIAVSLAAASQVNSFDTTRLSTRRFYFSDAILPDHVAYPVLMLGDRVKLELASTEEKIGLQLTYARRRFLAAEELAIKGRADLSLATLTKSQKYLLAAGHAALDQASSPATTSRVIAALRHESREIERLTHAYPELDDQALDVLNEESKIMISHLENVSGQ